MDWKDTVMGASYILVSKSKYPYNSVWHNESLQDWVIPLLSEQAEITWEARQPEIEQARLEGMKELMELWRQLANNNQSVKIPFEIEDYLKSKGMDK